MQHKTKMKVGWKNPCEISQLAINSTWKDTKIDGNILITVAVFAPSPTRVWQESNESPTRVQWESKESLMRVQQKSDKQNFI